MCQNVNIPNINEVIIQTQERSFDIFPYYCTVLEEEDANINTVAQNENAFSFDESFFIQSWKGMNEDFLLKFLPQNYTVYLELLHWLILQWMCD